MDSFDQITAILNYSCAPISSYTEIYLLNEFNQTYLDDFKETFYNYVDIDYRYATESGTALFAEGSTTITSDATSFKSIDYCRNPDMSNSYELIGYGSELFDNFEIYLDESSILYTADIEMDGEPDYKHTIDIDKDGKIDIIKYGIDDPQGSDEIYWHTIIQDFQSTEIKVSQQLKEKTRTEWFDINDKIFAHFDFNIGKLLLCVFCLPLLPLYITEMMLPDVDYWAQKSSQDSINKEEHTKTTFYSVKVDNDRNGLPDVQFNYEKTDIDIYYEVTEYRETILAAKFQNILTFVGEYIARSFASFFTGSYEDIVFNEQLTKEHLESQDFSTCNSYTQSNAPTLSATYRKFTENVITAYIDSFEQSALTIIDFDEEGEIEEQRIYTDDFDNNEIEEVEGFFSELSTQHSITNIDTGQQHTVDFDPELPFTHFENLTWEGKTWGIDHVPVKFDSLQVIGQDSSYITNVFERTIIIRLPNRFSLYNDYGKASRYQTTDNGWVEFEVTGMLITPLDGQVYYTSDAESFVGCTAKTSGHYFYVDTDQNGFYETVYILSDVYLRPDASGLPQYNVLSIGLNYDGIHDFAPYERLDQRVSRISDLNNLGKESTKFGTNWIYNFDNLDNCRLLWEEDSPLEKLGLKPKDHIFEIYKLAETSEQNSKFPKFFYEIRHKAYAAAWEQYRKQLIGDITEQVFMAGTAAVISTAVHAFFIWVPFVGLALAKALGTLAYFITYTLLTKFSIDVKMHEAQSLSRSQTFYADEIRDPISLNEKALDDRILGDSMAAALAGHPGGYYTEVSGGEPGNMYTGQALVSPPNYARIFDAFGGFLALLWENLWSMGQSDPDKFTALDFDDLNLDYLLHTSELPSYNQKLYYTYINTDNVFNQYNWYLANTLGYLEGQVRVASNNQLDAIRPTCVDGRPRYEFINSTLYDTVLPQQVLYRPIVLSEQRYNELLPALGHLILDTQCKDYSNTYGINPYVMEDIEHKAGYKAKIPINPNGFEYPISYISIDVIKKKWYGESYFAQDLIVNESYYAVEDGNLYFTKSLEEIISEKYQGFEETLKQTWIQELTSCEIYYKVHIFFDLFVPDTTEETNTLALAQATFYTIMDYFNQYTYAEVSANMISEIAYTETVTFWSTLISIPFMFLGAWTGKLAQEAAKKTGQEIVKTVQKSLLKTIFDIVLAPIREVFEEIIKDGFIEALAENLVDMVGLSEDLGFWISSLATSWRETKGALADILFDVSANLMNEVALSKALKAGDKDLATDLRNKIDQNRQQRQDKQDAKQEQKKTWQKLLGSDFFKGLLMLMPAFYFGTFDFLALSSLNKMVKGAIQLPKLYAQQKTIEHARRKAELESWFKDTPIMSPDNLLINNMKKPANIDGEALNNLFRERQQDLDTDTNTDLYNPPAVNIAPLFNPNPRIQQRNELESKFSDLEFESLLDVAPVESPSFKNTFLSQPDLEGDVNLMHAFYVKKDIFISKLLSKLELDSRTHVFINDKEIDADTYSEFILTPKDEVALLPFTQASGGPQENVDSVKVSIKFGDKEEALFPEFDRDRINYVHAKLFDPNYDQNKPKKALDQIRYRSDLILEAREILKTTKYKGLEIIVDERVNWQVLAFLQDKFNKGEKWTPLEEIIADVAKFYLSGGPVDFSSDPNYKRVKDIIDIWIERLFREYGALGALGPRGEKVFIKYMNRLLDSIIQSDPTLSQFRAQLMQDAMKVFEERRVSNDYIMNLVKRGSNLINTLFDAYRHNYDLSSDDLERFMHILQYGSESWDSNMAGFNIEQSFNRLRLSDRPESFEFLAQLFRDFIGQVAVVKEDDIIRAFKRYNPVFSVFLNEYYLDKSKNEGLSYLLKTEKYFKEYYERKHKKYVDAQGNINAILAMNHYCTDPDANWEKPSMTALQIKLLLDLWDGRDALTGERLRDENGNLLERVERHHYEVLAIVDGKIIFIKYDCRLVAQVPLSKSSHGKMKSVANADRYAGYFKNVMEKLMRGEWATPYWWEKTNPEALGSFEENLLRLGYVKPDNLEQ